MLGIALSLYIYMYMYIHPERSLHYPLSVHNLPLSLSICLSNLSFPPSHKLQQLRILL